MIVYVSDNNKCYLSLYLIWNTEQNTNFFVNNQTVGLAPQLSWRTLFPTTHFRTSRGAHCFRLVSAGIRSPHASERAAFHRLMTVLICSWYLFGRRGYSTSTLFSCYLLRTNRHHLDGDRASPDYV